MITVIHIEHEDCYGNYTVELPKDEAIRYLKDEGILKESDKLVRATEIQQ